jgi:hypothetical protein
VTLIYIDSLLKKYKIYTTNQVNSSSWNWLYYSKTMFYRDCDLKPSTSTNNNEMIKCRNKKLAEALTSRKKKRAHVMLE